MVNGPIEIILYAHILEIKRHVQNKIEINMNKFELFFELVIETKNPFLFLLTVKKVNTALHNNTTKI